MSRARCDPRACSGSLHDDLTGHPAHLPDQGLAPFSTPLPITSSMLLDLFYSRYHVRHNSRQILSFHSGSADSYRSCQLLTEPLGL